MTSDRLALVPYDRLLLDRSWTWLNDPEVKRLTMTPDFTRDEQLNFFSSLPGRSDYHIWGVSMAGHGAVGAAGLKNVEGRRGEYWGYIGERQFWGIGLGMELMSLVEDKAMELGVLDLFLVVSNTNSRALRLYENSGYRRTAMSNRSCRMEKTLASS